MIDLQEKIKDFCRKNDLKCNVQSKDIISQLDKFSESSEEFLKSTKHSKTRLEVVLKKMITEIRDGYSSLMGLIKPLLIEAENAIQMAIDK